MEPLGYELQIYPFQIDFMRHVSNIVYIQWMEIGRCLLLDAVGLPVSQTGEQGYVPVLVETIISYKKPLRLGDRVHGEIWLSELSHASAWMDFKFKNGAGDVAATGRQRGLFIDLESGRPRKMSPRTAHASSNSWPDRTTRGKLASRGRPPQPALLPTMPHALTCVHAPEPVARSTELGSQATGGLVRR